MMTVTRRTLLQGMAAGLIPTAGLSRVAFADAPSANQPILVLLHQRGGCDGLNLLSPATDRDFIDARISELRVSADGPDAGFAIPHVAAPHIDFRLHAVAGGLAELSKSGALAFIHACGLTNETRSHFVASDMIEHGVASDADLDRTTTGWLSRVLSGQSSNGLIAATASGAIDGDLIGTSDALAVPDVSGGVGVAGGPQVAAALTSLYSGDRSLVGTAGFTALSNLALVDGKIPRDGQGHALPYPSSGLYDSAGNFGRGLKTVAQLIKMDIGLRAVTVDFGEWDTHEYQAGRFKSAVDRLSKSISAFWNDMAPYHDRVVLVMITEFGRRLRNNKSNGTDHGRGSVAAVLGGKVRGGRILGTWPGLKTEQLDEGVDLAVTTDYRQVLSEVLNAQAGHGKGAKPDPAWFPGFKGARSVGLFG